MTALAVVVTAAYAVVNAFGTWAILRRRQAVALGFMASAVVLTVAAVATGFGHPSAFVLALLGAVGASLTSWINARTVLGRVVPWRHVLRAAYGGLVVLLVGLALRA